MCSVVVLGTIIFQHQELYMAYTRWAFTWQCGNYGKLKIVEKL